MTRRDALGMFWFDPPPVKVPKQEKQKCTPPPRTWEDPSYLPGLEEATRFDVQLMTDAELVCAAAANEVLVYDVECYANYFLVSFQSLKTRKLVYFEISPIAKLDIQRLDWVMHCFCIVSFNGNGYDLPIIALALAGFDTAALKRATNEIILGGMAPWELMRSYKLKGYKEWRASLNHIDLMEVAPLRASLKIYGGRLHSQRMQDLPFHHERILSQDQAIIVRWYNVNDLRNTILLYECLHDQLKLRELMSDEYGVDLRSRSDAQIAEDVITEELQRISYGRIKKPEIAVGTCYRYNVPSFLRFATPLMQWVLWQVASAQFIVAEHGSIEIPPEIKELKITIGNSVYQMGIGGLHSTEESVGHVADENNEIEDIDATSYYPWIILRLGLYPQQLGPAFLRVYKGIVDRRVAAKKAGQKSVAESLKIVVNGSYGKLGSKYSVLYAPDLLIQVTMTGQLSLLLLVERFELNGISVVSGNTDGIVTKCPKHLIPLKKAIIKQWEIDTGFVTESVLYKCLYSRDVNNYIAVKTDGTTKTKGAYANPWNDDKNKAMRLHKNPTNQICVEAIEDFLVKGVSITETINKCRDITKFVSVRKVKGGAVQAGDYLGSSIRWYYCIQPRGDMVYAESGKKVPRSDGARPLMDLPKEFPTDIDYNWYIEETVRQLKLIGYIQ